MYYLLEKYVFGAMHIRTTVLTKKTVNVNPVKEIQHPQLANSTIAIWSKDILGTRERSNQLHAFNLLLEQLTDL